MACDQSNCQEDVRFIRLNRTPGFLFYGNDPKQQADQRYWLHSVQRGALYTGSSVPSPVPFAPDYFAISFRELMEHEIGHYFGLLHPDQVVGKDPNGNDIICQNNATHCEEVIVMTAGLGKNESPHPLTDDDKCMFKKLYCTDCENDVRNDRKIYGFTQPSIYPNPASGNAFLEYSLSNENKVEISIFNMLGEKVIDVVNESQASGGHIVSLPTRYLSSGEYICLLNLGAKTYTLHFIISK